jgi:simple sugar transport system ATP-binding protein
LDKVSARRGNQALHDVSLEIHGGEVIGIAGVSGNGQSLLADCISGTWPVAAGSIELNGKPLDKASPREAVEQGIARIPEDRHAEGMIGDMSITENAIAERYRSKAFSSRGLVDWRKARTFAESIITTYDVKCPGPEARVRLLSGGNMQKLILGRVMANDPKLILANQPTRGLDVGAVAYVHEQLLAARKRGAGILLISEDLDELLALSDKVAVMFKGELSSHMPRQAVTISSLGLLMAGQGFSHAA